MLDTINFSDFFTYDSTSPSGLVWKVFRAGKTGVGSIAGTDAGRYYKVGICGKRIYTHRIVWELHNGPIPQGSVIDHIDGDSYNNSIENLRLCTQSQNTKNKSKQNNNTTGYTGVVQVRNRWKAQIQCNGKRKHLGTFLTPEDAYEAYKQAAIELFGEFNREV